MRRGLGVLAVAAGLVLAGLPIAYGMFDRTADAERILDRFEFLTAQENPDRYLAEAETTREGSAALIEAALPTLAAEAGTSLGPQEFPALVRAREEIPRAEEFSVRYSEQLEAVKGKFRSAYDIPAPAVALTAVPWLLLAAGLASLLVGATILRRPSAAGSWAALALGLALIAGLVALDAPGNAADAEDVKDFASRGLTATAADAAQRASAALDGLVAETEGRIIPALAAEREVAPAAIREELSERFPSAGEFLEAWDVIGPRLARLADAVSASVGEFDSAKVLPIAFPVWLIIGFGAALAAGGGAALLGRRRAGRMQPAPPEIKSP